MTNLNWLTPDSVYLYYRRWGSRRTDGLSTCDFIAKWQPQIAYEIGVFERSGALEKDRWEFERKTKPMETLIRDAERDVVNLMKLQAERGGWIAFGRRHPDAEEEVIPSQKWPFLDLDIETRVATGYGMMFRAVCGLIRRQIPSCHPILGRIRMAERLPETAAGSVQIAQAQILEISATPIPDSAVMHTNVPDCPSRPTKIENTTPQKWISRMSFVKQEFRRPEHPKQRTKWKQAEVLAKWFNDNFTNEVPLPEKAIRNWLYSREGRIAWDAK